MVPNAVWVVVHLATLLVGLYYLTKARADKGLLWAFILYMVAVLLYTLVHLGAIDNFTTHIVETVLVLVAFILVGQHAVKCCAQ